MVDTAEARQAAGGRSEPAVLPMRRPLVALAASYTAGIFLQSLLPLPWEASLSSVALALLAAAALALARVGGPFRFLLWMTCLLFLGWARGVLPPLAPLPLEEPGRLVVAGEARSSWQLGEEARRLEIEVASVRLPGSEAVPARGHMLLSVLEVPANPGKDGGTARTECPVVLPGDRVRVLGSLHVPWATHNPGVPDFELLSRRRGIDWRGTARSCADFLVEAGPATWSLGRFVERWRDSLARFVLGRTGSEGGRGVLLALTNGDEGKVPQATWEDFRNSGLAHLLSISGLHLAIVALGVYGLLLKLFARIRRLVLSIDIRRLAAALAVPVTILYTLLAGANLPVVRSGIMVLCFLAAVLLRRRAEMVQTLSAAVLIVLGLWPQALFEASFQLSFGAVASILLLVPVLSRWLRMPLSRADWPEPPVKRLLLRAAQVILVSVATTLGTLPVGAWHFHQASLVGLVANLVAIPFSTLLIVPLGLLVAVLHPVSVAAAGFLADLGSWLSDALAAMAHWFARWPGSTFHPATPTAPELVLWYFLLLLLPLLGRRRWASWTSLAAAGLLLLSWGTSFLQPLLSSRLAVTFVDVGQGDSALIRFPGGATMLVDAGGSPEGTFDTGERVVAPTLWAQGIRRLDVVALTHEHPDHGGGLPSVIRLFSPRELWTTRPLTGDPLLEAVAAAAQRSGTSVRLVTEPGPLFEAGGCQVAALWPAGAARGFSENDRSLVLKLSIGSRAFLLTGDLEQAGEEGLLRGGAALKADVLKVGHHGSDTSSGESFLAAVKPAEAVISVGAGNRYGFPNPKVVDRIEKAGAQVRRTDRDGAVTVVTDGETLEVETALAGQQR